MLAVPMLSVGASGIKLDESFIGQKQTVSGMTSKDFYLHVNRGDNISFESVKVSQGYGIGIRTGAGGNVFYLKSSNDSLINGWNIPNSQPIKFWFIPSTEDIIDFYIFTGYVLGCSVDFYINRTNATSNDQGAKIAELEKAISLLNSTMNNLTKSVSLINMRIGALNNTTNSSVLEINNWISQLRNETNILIGRLDNLSIPKEVNLTNLYNQVNTLSELVSSLQENISRLSVITNTTVYVNTTTIKNETHSQSYYLYDNSTLGALKKNITDTMKNIQEIENSIGDNQNETGQVASNVTSLQNKVSNINSTTVQTTEIKKYQTTTTAEAQNYAIIGVLITIVVCFAIWNVILTHEVKKIKLEKEIETRVHERTDEIHER